MTTQIDTREMDTSMLWGMRLFIHVMKLEATHPLRVAMKDEIFILMTDIGDHLPQKYRDAWAKGETI